MPESLRAAPSVNSAITAQKLNENQLKYSTLSGVPRTRYTYMIRMYTRAGSAARVYILIMYVYLSLIHI